ncbi:MAG: dCTP deaminase [Methanomicrobia archaeon]|nr:dCTP deaminase [Methanomicrobia archaeon]
MILSDRDILKYMENKDLIIDPFSRDSLQSSGYDLRFGGEYILNGNRFKEDILELPPKKYGILSTLEKIGLKNLIGDIKLRSSFCREGLIGSFGWVDPGWMGVLSLSVFNSSENPVIIRKEERFAQITFIKLSSEVEKEYNGRYKWSKSSEGSKRL